MTYSRLIGALFVTGFVVYGAGAALVASVTGAPDFVSTISAHQTTLGLGAFLMLLNTMVEVGKGVLFFPILDNYGRRRALTYLALMIVEVVMLDVGVLALLMIVPLSQQAVVAGPEGVGLSQTLGSLAVQANAMAYQIAEMSLGLGGLFLCSVLFQTRLIPRFLSVGGFIGYASLMAGTIAELFGIHIGLALSIPGIFFELGLPVWLFTKGFAPEVYGGSAEPMTRPAVAAL
jgi:hypothetical protein